LSFDEKGLDHAKKASTRYAQAHSKAIELLGREPAEDAWKAHEDCIKLDGEFTVAMNDDFNTAKAFAVIFDLVTRLNTAISSKADTLEALASLMARFRNALGIGRNLELESANGLSDDLTSGLLELLIDVRNTARKKKVFEIADEIRNRLKEQGITLEDGPGGTTWKKD
jgi:cysteinyl-tRNA synthetase